jgi:hypothetical protein
MYEFEAIDSYISVWICHLVDRSSREIAYTIEIEGLSRREKKTAEPEFRIIESLYTMDFHS